MANPFSNVCKSVEAYSFNKTNDRKIDKMTESAAANSALRKMKAEEQDALMETQLIKDAVKYHQNKMNEGIVRRYVKESQIPNNINRINNTAKDYIFKDILFEVFYNSLLMDAEFLRENTDKIKCVIDKYVDDCGGFKMLNDAIKNNLNNELLKRIKAVCESIAKEVCDRKLADAKECKDMDLIDFDMNDEEKEHLDYSKSQDLDIERISNLVKDKVLTVVKDEKARQEEDHDRIEKIEEELKDDEEVTDEKSLNEALNKIVLNKPVIEQSTLFNAIFRDCYHEFITENVAITSTDKENIDSDKEMSRHYNTEMTIDDALNNESPVEDTEIDQNLVLHENSSKIDMDMVLVEAITKYTLMETLYTIGLENYSPENIRKLTERMLNPVTESTVVQESGDFIEARSNFFKIFNKLKDEPENETYRTKMSSHISEFGDKCKGFVKIAQTQIEDIIEKNPNMEEKYNNLSKFMDECLKGKSE